MSNGSEGGRERGGQLERTRWGTKLEGGGRWRR